MTEIVNQKTYGVFLTAGSLTFINGLSAKNSDFIEFPAIKIVETKLSENEIRQLKNITDFDWLIFFEPVSVDIFLKRLAENEVDFFELDNLRICVLGEMTADRLRFEQIHSDIIFTGNTDPGALIRSFIADNAEFSSQKLLISGNFEQQAEIQKKSIIRKMDFSVLNVYELFFEEIANLPKLKALLNGDAVDEFILTSPEELLALEKLYRDAESENWLKNNLQLSGNSENLVLFLKEKGWRAKLFK